MDDVLVGTMSKDFRNTFAGLADDFVDVTGWIVGQASGNFLTSRVVNGNNATLLVCSGTISDADSEQTATLVADCIDCPLIERQRAGYASRAADPAPSATD